MLTFVISDNLRQPGLGLAAPFLYPLLAAGTVRLVPPAVPLEQVDEFIRLEVRFGYVPRWQLFFLVHQDDHLSSPLDDSLPVILYRLQRIVLDPLAAAGLQPQRVWIGVLDETRRQAEDMPMPLNPLAQERRRLEATGAIGAAQFPFLISEAELQALGQIWGSPLDLSGQRLDAGLDSLPPELREEVQRRLADLREQATTLVDAKLQALREAELSPAAGDFYQAGLERILREYLGYLTSCPQQAHVHWADGCRPAEEFGRLLRQQVSWKPWLASMLIIFFRDSSHYQRLLLQTVYGLITVAALPESASLPFGRVYHCRVTLSPEGWSRMVAEHRAVAAHWQARLRRTEAIAQTTAESLPDPTLWNCPQVLEVNKIPDLSWPLLHTPMDQNRWQGWRAEVQRIIDEQAGRAQQLLHECQGHLQQIHRPVSAGATPLETASAHLQEKLKEIRRKLLYPEGQKVSAPGRLAALGPETAAVTEAISQRPTLLWSIKVAMAGVILSGLPQMLSTWLTWSDRELWLCLECLGIFGVGSVAATVAGLWWLRRRLAKLFLTVKFAAEGELQAIFQRFQQGKRFLENFFYCQALEERLRRVQEEAARREELHHLRRYHDMRLNQHLEDLDTLARLMGLTLPDLTSSQQASEVPEDIHRPAEFHPVYHPAWDPTGAGHHDVQVHIGLQQSALQLPALRGVESVAFSDCTDDLQNFGHT